MKVGIYQKKISLNWNTPYKNSSLVLAKFVSPIVPDKVVLVGFSLLEEVVISVASVLVWVVSLVDEAISIKESEIHYITD